MPNIRNEYVSFCLAYTYKDYFTFSERVVARPSVVTHLSVVCV